ncbi:MAG: sigma-70 family RNA polymerase sigma factor [Petrimonas sp.]|uniref:RNA polymerase sigma factor n=1 Tax=Petrimonas sp. TaxID=2023866 RepID=UPI00095FE348|nr:sigma-70 family RNA polymerase sigma factor [Petrimonas sp.]MEA5046817.1 sigma-70 family RNA polymerase sigma factor [Petrimonas sp.]OJV32466.1 MAG: RNA polymerase subunit sigma-70 [Bacteroidia bacterium 43-41]
MTSKEAEREFIELIEKHSRLIYKVCFMYASDNDELNDLYQEVLINLWRSHDAFRGNATYSTWIYRIGLNTCISYIRQKKRRPLLIPLDVDLENIAEQKNNREELRELYRLINQLSKIEKAIVLLYLEEKTYDEISEIVGITRGNVGVKLNRIKTKLKEMSNQ